MKKRLFTWLLCLLLLLTLPTSTLAAETDSAPKLCVETSLQGTALVVSVRMENNPGIAGFDLTLRFDGTVLTPSAEPMAAEAWEYMSFGCPSELAGDALKAVGVSCENIPGDCELLTAYFTVKGSGDYGLYADCTACTLTEDGTLYELPTVFSTYFAAKVVSSTMHHSGDSVSGAVKVAVLSYGEGFRGEAKAVLACYRDGKYCGCTVQSLTAAENGRTELTLENIQLPYSAGMTFRLLLLRGDYVPLAVTQTLTAD